MDRNSNQFENSEIAQVIFDLALLHGNLHEKISKNYFNSQPVINLTYHSPLQNLEFNLADILLISAITQSNILLSGSSGCGKTYLAELMSELLFGKNNFSRKNITPDMNEQDFMDIDFGAIKEGKRLKEALLPDALFGKPCLLIDEANRAPPIIQNRLMQILENNIDLKSKIINSGVKLDNGNYYHWNILTLNYGQEYTGTSTVDRALKDRIAIDLPIDNFPPKIDDQIKMIRGSLEKTSDLHNEVFEDIVYDIYSKIEQIPLSLEAEALILYMSFTSNCVKSPTGSKYGVIFSPQFCKERDCKYARNPPLNKICPYTFAPSNRVLRKLVHISKGFCLLKHSKIIEYILNKEGEKAAVEFSLSKKDLEVTIDDLISIAPLVLHSKISMDKNWVFNKFNGNTYLACKQYIKIINSRLDYFMKNILSGVVKEKRGDELSEREKGLRKKELRKDFHFEGLIKYVKKYLN